MTTKYCFLIAAIIINSLCSNVFSQTGFSDNTGYLDPAISHNKLLREQNGDGVYKLIGPYKVVGTSYLFGEKTKGDLFSTEATGHNIFLSYNTYNQEVEFYSTSNPDKPLIKEPGTVDSFIINENADLGITSPIKFIYGTYLGSAEKSFFKELYTGSRFSVYKRYKSELGYVSTNYVQSELRQFDLVYDYFYTDSQNKGLKKLKTNISSIIKEFKDVKDISPVLTNDAFTVNQENALEKTFEYLNN